MGAPPIAVFGGAFDPVHTGHLGVIDYLKSEGGFREVWVLPTGDRNPKKPQVSAEHRLACLKIALARTPDVRIEPIELGPRGPLFTTDTLTALGRPKDELCFVIGTDQFVALEGWKNFPRVLGQCHWLVLERPGVSPEPIRAAFSRYETGGVLRRAGSGSAWETLENTFLEIRPVRTPLLSSSELRRELALDGMLSDPRRLPPGVDAYLMQHGLYGRTAT